MSVVRQIKCDIECCDTEATESLMGDGWTGWGLLTGKRGDNGETEFGLCPDHLDMIFGYIKNLSGGK